MSTQASPPDIINSNPTNDSPTPTTTATATSIFTSLHNYPFESDTAFLSGLSQIFGHPGTPVTEAELFERPDLILSAKCFYYRRRFQIPDPIDPAAYKTWLATSPQSQDVVVSPSSITPTPTPATAPAPAPDPATATATATAQTQPTPVIVNTTSSTPADDTTISPAAPASAPAPPPPPYPTSFAAIVDLITNNKPIPGIEEIPTTILEPGSSKQDKATRRRKPWEKEVEEEDDGGDLSLNREDTAGGHGGNIDGAQQHDATGEETGLAAVSLASAESVEDPFPESTTHIMRRPDRGEGVMRLLRPDAVPDSGLIAKE